MLSKARFTVNTAKLKQNSKTAKSTTNSTETLTLSNTTAAATTSTAISTIRATKRTTSTAATSILTRTRPNAVVPTTTTATNSCVINYQRCCWHFLLCCYCCLFICIVQQHGIQAEISSVSDISGVLLGGSIGVGGGGGGGNAGSTINSGSISALLNNFDGAASHCSSRKFNNMAKTIDDVEDLELDVPVNIAFDNRQRKR
ncbi:uncharacterized protein LOC124421032 [Lucilia cuprina]|uniref:uncharacterized protein LOC124421032 n=1 Tax=Lucilia cuprina TaxID=7375 RepID=UPI001F059E09|nr:uncharacterized protein LOC124421032 [Lucilia cuprina]XP_046811725.1 uncharacterized protein LOC124421032 [Lucilia cuprina]XP_046811726.1 uncharacterized protein LOC124421032 [Lucilia cuprina]XP_046811727.1 uncharacterized protein LOC124421032 [Lucilia cuprina]